MASTSSPNNDLNVNAILTYLGLPQDYEPSPDTTPVSFLAKHLPQLPSHLLHWFSAVTTPRERTAILLIRNRRFNFTQSDPPELRFPAAKRQWLTLWEGAEDGAREEAREEKEWVETTFLEGRHQAFVGKLGTLLGGYEEERQMELARQAKRGRQDAFVPEEDDSSDDENNSIGQGTPDTAEAVQQLFLRRVRERFIYGLLEVSLLDSSENGFPEFVNILYTSSGIFMTNSIGTILGTKKIEMLRMTGSTPMTNNRCVALAEIRYTYMIGSRGGNPMRGST
jgi:hypothetical protein